MKKTDVNKSKRIRRTVKTFDLLIVLFVVIAGIYLVFHHDKIQGYATNDIQYYGFWALFIFTFLFEFLPQIISPDYSLLLAIGMGINIPLAVFVTIIASSIGSWLAFIIGYHYGFKIIAPFFEEKKLDKIVGFWNKRGKWFVLAAGTVPLPVPYIPVVFGALRMRKRDFIFWGIIPRAIGFIATGIVGYFWFENVMKLFW